MRGRAPQVVQPHVLRATFCEIVRQRLPDVLAALLDAGAAEVSVVRQLPLTIADRRAAPGDER